MHYRRSMKQKISRSCLNYLLIIITISFFGCSKTMQANKIPRSNLQAELVRIYIVRPSSVGFVVSTDVYENNTIVGRIASRGYLGWDTKPGEITLKGGTAFIKILAEPGKTYYLKLRPTLSGVKSDGFSFLQITEDAGKNYLNKLKPPKVKVVS